MSLLQSAAPGLKTALVAAIASVVGPAVLVTYGHPGLEFPDDVIVVGMVTSAQDVATLSATNRSREETLTVTVTISSYRGGGPEMEVVAGNAAYALLGLIEYYVRVTDTTLGGVVRYCFLTAHTSQGETDPAFLAEGRTIEIVATFTAKARISGHN